VDCEVSETFVLRERFAVQKYPTLRVFRKGQVLKSEYRGQRTANAIETFVKELLRDPVYTAEGETDLLAKVDSMRNHQAIVGRFMANEGTAVDSFRKIASILRDNCAFVADTTSMFDSISFQSPTDNVRYEGDYNDETLLAWAREKCDPLVREITFENGEGLTEEGLPFLILFYDPKNLAPVKEFTQVITDKLKDQRGLVNFITADGTVFTHPLHVIGKSRSDLPILAVDTFKHMFVFKHFVNIRKPGRLEKFIADLHNGKLHRDFHDPPQGDEDHDEDLPTEGPTQAPITGIFLFFAFSAP
jgi:endoplasmic reticulum resident protein 44